jgi:hypothetical protein
MKFIIWRRKVGKLLIFCSQFFFFCCIYFTCCVLDATQVLREALIIPSKRIWRQIISIKFAAARKITFCFVLCGYDALESKLIQYMLCIHSQNFQFRRKDFAHYIVFLSVVRSFTRKTFAGIWLWFVFNVGWVCLLLPLGVVNTFPHSRLAAVNFLSTTFLKYAWYFLFAVEHSAYLFLNLMHCFVSASICKRQLFIPSNDFVRNQKISCSRG